MPFDDAVLSGLSIGVPGLVRLLEDVHKRARQAAVGEAVRAGDPRRRTGLRRFRSGCTFCCASTAPASFVPAARRYFFTDGGSALPMGTVLKNPEFAATLRASRRAARTRSIAGRSRRRIVDAVAAAPIAAGGMTLDDLKDYAVKERAPLCSAYRGHEICGVGPPSSGGPTVAQTLKLVEPFELGNNPERRWGRARVHLIAEAEKLAYADRNKYIGDPDFVAVPADCSMTPISPARAR